MKKVIISDFDDTLYSQNKISDYDIKKIKNFRKAGNLFVIATGSSYTSFIRKSSLFKLEYDYLIVNHGSTIYKNDFVISNETLDNKVLLEIINRYRLNDKYILESGLEGNFFSTAKKGLVKPSEKEITKIHLEFDSDNYLNEVNYLKNKYGDKINIYELLYKHDVEIISKNASKLIAIDRILDLETIDERNVYTIGDGYSDLEMIKKYNGYAVENAIDQVKQNSIKEVSCVGNLIEELL